MNRTSQANMEQCTGSFFFVMEKPLVGEGLVINAAS